VIVTVKFEGTGPQVATFPLSTALVGDGFTVTTAVPLNACEAHRFASITAVTLYVVLTKGLTAIEVPLT
jgi:hypothetical protein